MNQTSQFIKYSVIIPAYNAEKTIENCVDSVLSQSYGNFELIVVNDGSKDNTLDILRSYESKDNRLKIINSENQGVSAARNKGLDIAVGEYIVFIDADDYVDKDYLFQFSKSCADMIICGYRPFGRTEIINVPNHFHSTDHDEIIGYVNAQFNQAYICVPWCKAIKTRIFKDGNRFNARLRCGEDMDLILRIVKDIDSFEALNYVGYHYYAVSNCKYSLNANDYIMHSSTIISETYYNNRCIMSDARQFISDVCFYNFTSYLWEKKFTIGIINSIKWLCGGGV